MCGQNWPFFPGSFYFVHFRYLMNLFPTGAGHVTIDRYEAKSVILTGKNTNKCNGMSRTGRVSKSNK